MFGHVCPKDYCPQQVKLANAANLADLAPEEIVAHFRLHPDAARELLMESSDKRWVPSTFIDSCHNKYRVGWFSTECNYECEAVFDSLADAATDYLLFSFGKGRWTPAKCQVVQNTAESSGSIGSEEAIRELAATAPIELSEIYLQFLRRNDGAAGDLGMEPGHIVFWRAEEVLANNARHKVGELAPGFFAFGTDGGGKLFALDTRGAKPWPVVMIPMTHVDPIEAVQLASDFVAFLAACRLPPPVQRAVAGEKLAKPMGDQGGETLPGGQGPGSEAMGTKAISDFEAFLSSAGLKRSERDPSAPGIGYRVIEYTSREIGVRLVWRGALGGVEIADSSTSIDMWYDLKLFTYLLGGPSQLDMSFEEQLMYAKDHWLQIISSFTPDRRVRSHTQLQVATMERGRQHRDM